MVVFVFGASEDIVAHVVRFYFLLPFCKHQVFVEIETQFLFLPAFDVEATGETNAVEHAGELGLGRVEVALGEGTDVAYNEAEVFDFLLPTQRTESGCELFGQFIFAILGSDLCFFARIEVGADGVLAIVQDGAD